MIQGSTGVFDPALGNMGDQRKEKSGRAILALQQHSDAGNSHYLHNLAQISMLYEAKVLLDLFLRYTSDRAGRWRS